MKINHLKKILNEFNSDIRFEYDLKKKNWFNIGGKSKVFFKADHLNQLINFLKILFLLFIFFKKLINSFKLSAL